MVHIRLQRNPYWHLSISPPWHKGPYHGFYEVGVKCLQSGSDSLLRVAICCKSHMSDVLLNHWAPRDCNCIEGGDNLQFLLP